MRLPATYAESGRAVSEAIHATQWEELGQLSRTKATANRPAALYRGAKSTVALYGKPYRAVVVDSSAHDRRGHQKIEWKLAKEQASSACPRITMPFWVGGAHQWSSRWAQSTLRSHQEQYLFLDGSQTAGGREGSRSAGRDDVGFDLFEEGSWTLNGYCASERPSSH